MGTKKRIYSLDLLRAFACFCILTIHFNATVEGYYNGMFLYPQNGFAPNFYLENRLYLGDIGVSIFFMLTGASLMLSTRDWKGCANFYKKRFLAIFPSFWLVYIVVFLIDLYRSGAPVERNPLCMLSTLIGFDGYVGLFRPEFYMYYKIGEWFLGCLILLYIIYPILRFFYVRYSKTTFIVVVLGYFLYQLLARNFNLNNSSYLFYLRVPELVLGMAFVENDMRSKPLKLWGISSSFFIICILSKNYISQMTLNLAFCMLLSSFIIILGERIQNEFVIKAITWLAGLTYPAFLIHHWFIHQFVTALNINLETISKSRIIVIYVIYIVVIFVLSELIQKIVKKLLKIINIKKGNTVVE